ncbi:hypothetical protein HYE31_02480 [Mycoplasmopsis bovis]|nr:hypothetical protein HYE31_02480 [Mycoplasmopsis bovis]
MLQLCNTDDGESISMIPFMMMRPKNTLKKRLMSEYENIEKMINQMY